MRTLLYLEASEAMPTICARCGCDVSILRIARSRKNMIQGLIVDWVDRSTALGGTLRSVPKAVACCRAHVCDPIRGALDKQRRLAMKNDREAEGRVDS